uniref:VWFA domain-containing protein n=1 Tax=Mola mola TaxID=94237 RepID=A0A3Q3X043_MOLML
ESLKGFVSWLIYKKRENILRFLCSVSAACEDVQTDIIFLTSIFERIPAKEYQTMKDFMKSVIHKSTIGRNKVHFGVMQFSNDQQRVLPLNRHYSKEDMSKAIDEMQQVNKSTHTGKAITEATKYFEAIQGGRPDLRQSLIVITDGKAEDYIVRPAAALRAKGVVIYAIGVLDANPAQLLEITNSPDSVFNARNFDALKDLENRVILKHRRQIICTCASYFILHSHSTWDFKKEKADLVFLLDMSGSIGVENYAIMINFTAELLKSFKVSNKFVRVGLAQFSDTPAHEFFLNDYSKEEEVVSHVLRLKYSGGNTYIGKALDHIKNYFKSSTGSRYGVSKNLVLITDGDSYDDVEDVAERVRALGVEMFAIGIGNFHSLKLLQIAGDPQRLFNVRSFSDLENIKNKLFETICKSKPIPEPTSKHNSIFRLHDIQSG